MQIYDFSCISELGVTSYIGATIGAAATLASLLIAALLGKLVLNSRRFQPDDIFTGWGLIAAVMTIASMILPSPLIYLALALFLFAIIAALHALPDGYFKTPFLALLFFPGIFVAAKLNLVGLGMASFDDYSHWVPNAIYLLEYDGIPSLARPAIHSLYAGYPYGLPFMVYLASLIGGGVLVVGGTMINFFLICIFAWMAAELCGTETNATHKIFNFATFLLIAVFFTGSNYTPFSLSVSNQADVTTMACFGALGLMFHRLLLPPMELMPEERRRLMVSLACTGLAFVLIKQTNIVMLLLLGGGFTGVGFLTNRTRNTYLQPIAIIVPALLMRLLWGFYASREILGGNHVMLPLSMWRLYLMSALEHGAYLEFQIGPLAFLPSAVATILAIATLFIRKRPKWAALAWVCLFVQLGYVAFLVMTYIGADFVEYETRVAASLHRYILHTAYLDLVLFWLAAHSLYTWLAAKAWMPQPRLSKLSWGIVTCTLLIAWPGLVTADPELLAMRPDKSMCRARQSIDQYVTYLPDHAHLGIVYTADRGYLAFMLNYRFALEDLETGRKLDVAWHIDDHLMMHTAGADQIAGVFRDHPETNALLYSPRDIPVLEAAGLPYDKTTDALILTNGQWKHIDREGHLGKKP